MAQADIKAVITAEDNGSAALRSFGKTIDGVNSSVKESSNKFAGLWTQVTKGTLVTEAVTKGIGLITSSIGDAIKRVDTLNNANRTFQNMGFHTDNVKKSMDALNKSILGLPTPLNEAVSGVTMLAAANNNLGQAQQVYTALNDAILGFGGSTADVNNAVLQLSQDMAGGVLHAQTWNSLLQSGVGPTLAAMARQMGITTAALRSGLSDGSISVNKFSQALISMDKNGGGGLKSLHQIALDSTNGISTSMANAQTAIVRALANIIQSIGQANIANAIKTLGDALATVITAFGKLLNITIEFFPKLEDYLNRNKTAILAVAGVITTLLLPAIIKFGVEATIAGAKSLAASVVSSTAWITSAVATSASFYTQMVKVIGSFTMTAARATESAAITSAKWVGSAIATSVSWLREMSKVAGSMALTAIKSTPYAIDTSLAWTINAVRVSFVWVTQEMPKLLVSFARTSFRATVEAGKTSLAWTVSAAKSSFVWVVTELPKIVLSFILTSASATKEAGVSSLAWVTSASKSSFAWVVQTVPQIILAFIMTSASAVKNAAISSAAWIKSATTTSQTYRALQALVSTPMVMPALVVVAALASIAQVMRAVQAVNGAIRDMNASHDAIAKAADSTQGIFQQEALYKAGKITKAQETKAINALLAGTDAAEAQSRHRASGGNVAAGQSYMVGERGQELFVPNQSGTIVPNSKLGGGSVNISINAQAFMGSHVQAREFARIIFKELQSIAITKNTTVANLVLR